MDNIDSGTNKEMVPVDPLQESALPVEIGEHVVTQAEVQACCSRRPMACDHSTLAVPGLIPESLVLGIDWGGGTNARTAFVIGAHDEQQNFHVLYLERLALVTDFGKDVARAVELIDLFGLSRVAAGGQGHGSVLNRNLLDQVTPRRATFLLYNMRYVDAEKRPEHKDDVKGDWSIDKTRALGDVLTRVRRRRITFPLLQHCGPLLEEIWREVAEYDAKTRKVRYFCPADANDDVLHALVYALRASTYILGSPHLSQGLNWVA